MCSCHLRTQRAQIGLQVSQQPCPSPSPLISSIAGTIAATMEHVAIFDSPGKGRGLKATKEFWAGDVIFSEPSLAAVVFDRYSNDGKFGGLWPRMCPNVAMMEI